VLVAAAALALVSHDALPARAASTSRVASALANGHWVGDFGEMSFAVSGARVRGAYTHDRGMFLGEIHGNRIVGRWCEVPYAPDRDTGEATLVLEASGNDAHVTGHWRYAGDREWAGRWALQPVAAAAPAALTDRLSSDTWQCGGAP
jgi:hypothetical protein